LICPICKKGVETSSGRNPYRPFCSERCRLVDLGSWLDGERRISSPLSEVDLDQGGGESSDPDPSRRPD
jgi:uncharacterized protein